MATSVSSRPEVHMRRFVVGAICLIGFLALASLADDTGRPQAQAPPPADLVLINGTVLTVNASDAVAEAVAIAGGKIVAVGTTGAIRSHIGSATQVIDLRGRTATPGLIDAHVHFSEAEALFSVNLSDLAVKRMEDVLARVRGQVAKSKPGEWVRGSGWDEGKLAEHRYVTAADLDAVAPNNPVWLIHTTGHYGVANSLALKLAHITIGTAEPTAGTIDRDSRGNPTGVLKEDSAMKPVTSLIPSITSEQMRQGILYIQEVLHREG